MWWLSVSSAWAAECDPNAEVATALQHWIAQDIGQVRTALAQATDAFACSGIVEPQALARYWLLDGALRWHDGARSDARASFAAARRTSVEVWLLDLGPELHEVWTTAAAPEGTGQVMFQADPGPGAVWIDGVATDTRVLAAGLHLVQVTRPGTEQVGFAEVIWVDPGIAVLVEPVFAAPAVAPPTPDPAPVSAPAPVAGPPPASPTLAPELQLLVGAGGAYGREVHAAEDHEPALKITVPLEIGLGIAGPAWFARAQLGGAALLDGRYLATGSGGAAISRVTRLDLGAAVGYGEAWRVGLAGGVQWPSRIAGRALVGWLPAPHVVGELRLGLNVTTDPGVEPAAELLVGVRL